MGSILSQILFNESDPFSNFSLSNLKGAPDFSYSSANLSGILGIVSEIAFYAGIVLLAYSIMQFVLSFQSENNENKIRAISLIVFSASLISLKFILNYILSGTGVQI